ncbi:MAG: hypothetical protein WBA74_04375 [Cyclobacteriaceae bacterium]
MSIDEQTAAKIDDYLNARLSTEETLYFEAEIAMNPELSDEVEIQKNLLQIIGENNISLSATPAFSSQAINEISGFLISDEMKQIRKNVKIVHSEYFRKEAKNRSMIYSMIGLAASVILILCISLLFQNKTDKDGLYATYKDLYQPLSLVERSNANVLPTSIEKSFENKNYEQVLQYINDNQRLANQYPSLFLYEGIAYREMKKYNQALHAFDNYGIYSDLDLELVYWHKGLVYLSMQDYKSALEAFEKIDTTGNFKGVDSVKEIIRSLK